MNPPIGDLNTAIRGISCIGLSIISKALITVFTSRVSKYPPPPSEKRGIPTLLNSSINIGESLLLDLKRITISL